MINKEIKKMFEYVNEEIKVYKIMIKNIEEDENCIFTDKKPVIHNLKVRIQALDDLKDNIMDYHIKTNY